MLRNWGLTGLWVEDWGVGLVFGSRASYCQYVGYQRTFWGLSIGYHVVTENAFMYS